LQYVSLALLAAAALWLLASVASYFALDLPWLVPATLAATVALPFIALAIEMARKPSLADTAALLDRRLDNRQRLVTSVELLSRQPSVLVEGVQLDSTSAFLGRMTPKVIYPVRAPVALWSWSLGLLMLALGLYVLRGAGSGFAPIEVGSLPPDQPVASIFATATPESGLPASELTPEATATGLPTEIALGGQGQQPGDSENQSGQPSGDPQAQAADSQEAQSALDRLSEALDQQSATQAAGDSLRQGDARSAADELRELGEENDQLSDDAKRGLAEALERAADETEANPALREAENRAARALREGDYESVRENLERLAEQLEQTAAEVVPQDELAQSFPSPTVGTDEAGGESDEAGDAEGSEGGEEAGGEESGGEESGEGQEGSGSPGGNEGAPQGEGGDQPGQGGAETEGGEGQSQSGAPGQGTRVGGPKDDSNLNVEGNPFEIESNADPNNNSNPGDGEEPPGLTLEGGSGQGSALPARPGGTVDAPAENTGFPLDRWDIIRRYFSQENGR
jgi:hypothetical protein